MCLKSAVSINTLHLFYSFLHAFCDFVCDPTSWGCFAPYFAPLLNQSAYRYTDEYMYE